MCSRNFPNGMRSSETFMQVLKVSKINLDCLVLSQIKRSSRGKIVPFPLVFYRLGCIFHFDKETSRRILNDLQKSGLIRVHDFHGVEILRTKKTVKL